MSECDRKSCSSPAAWRRHTGGAIPEQLCMTHGIAALNAGASPYPLISAGGTDD